MDKSSETSLYPKNQHGKNSCFEVGERDRQGPLIERVYVVIAAEPFLLLTGRARGMVCLDGAI